MKNLELLQEDSKKRFAKNNESNFDIIRRYVAADDPTLVLDDVQKQQLLRWNLYIDLKLSRQFSGSQIIRIMMDHFNIEKATVYTDMGQAEALFGYSSSINKRFRIAARIDLVEEKINEMYALENYDEAIKLEAVLERYYEAYPEIKQSKAARIINFNITKNEYNIEGLPSVEDALLILQKFETK